MNYYVKRFGQAVFTTWAVVTITFALIRWMPGGPLDFLRAQLIAGSMGPGGGGSIRGNPEMLRQFNRMAELYLNIRPDEPLYVQYANYMQSLVVGDLGQSTNFQRPVMDVLAPAIPWTLFVGSVAVFISFVTRVVIGSILAYKEGSRADFLSTTGLIWMHSTPFFIVAILLLFFLSYQWELFPIGGRYNSSVEPGLTYPFVAGILNHAALPILSLAWASFGAGALAMRANAIQVLGEDYLRIARLRGVRFRRLTILYVARNAILPMYTSMLIQIGFVFSGSVILEMIFQYKGVGFLIWRGIQTRDYPLMMGSFLVITITIVVAMFLADVTYSFVDPRIKRGGSEEAF